jgi:hypothetical protein
MAIASDVLEDGVLLVISATWPSSSHSASFSMEPSLSLGISVSFSLSKRGGREGPLLGEWLWWEGNDNAENSKSDVCKTNLIHKQLNTGRMLKNSKSDDQ